MPTSRNPYAGTAEETAPYNPETACSNGTSEPLPGTAKPGKLVLAMEYFNAWGEDILDGEALGKDLAKQISTYLKKYGATLQFIRRPGRAGQERQELPTRSLFIAWANGAETAESAEGNPAAPLQPILEHIDIHKPEDLLDIELGQPGHTPGATRVDGSILLICTHGKRDVCCAVKGRPVAAKVGEHYSEVWESSHTKGHRFAPSMIMLPSNYSYGHLSAIQVAGNIEADRQGRTSLQGNRGRGTMDPASQVAELAVLDHLARSTKMPPRTLDLNVYRPDEEKPAHLLGKLKEKGSTTRIVRSRTNTEQQWTVELEQKSVSPVRSSCGDPVKSAYVWVATAVH